MKCHVKMERESRVMLPRPKECPGPPEVEGAKQEPPERLPREHGPTDTSMSDF